MPCIKSKRLVEYPVSQLDFPSGHMRKYLTRPVASFPERIRLAFVRGLFDADGSIAFSRKTYREHKYPTIEIKAASRRLSVGIRNLLTDAGFRSSLNRSAENWTMRINGKAMLERWMERVGSRNIRHLTKYLVWKKDCVCPPNTTVSERMNMIGDWDVSSMMKT
jgi:LAGLIDADG-like domain